MQASDNERPDSVPGQSVGPFLCTRWRCSRFSSSISVSSCQSSSH